MRYIKQTKTFFGSAFFDPVNFHNPKLISNKHNFYVFPQERLQCYGFEKRYRGPIGSPEDTNVGEDNGELESSSGDKPGNIIICFIIKQ